MSDQHDEMPIPPSTSQPLPKTLKDLKEQASQVTRRCSSCQKLATHTVNLTIAKLGAGRGAVEFTIPKVPTCESCAAQLGGVVRKALKL